ncbi:MAG: hypothetical protein QXZ44_01095 [Ferroplasma sp.]
MNGKKRTIIAWGLSLSLYFLGIGRFFDDAINAVKPEYGLQTLESKVYFYNEFNKLKESNYATYLLKSINASWRTHNILSLKIIDKLYYYITDKKC